MERFKKLKVWEEAHKLVLLLYKMTQNFPKEEMFGLVSQIRRAVESIPTNIAEGRGRKYRQDYIRFLYIARGSLYETEYHLLLAKDLGYITEAQFAEVEERINLIGRLINGLIKAIATEKEVKNPAGRRLPTAS